MTHLGGKPHHVVNKGLQICQMLEALIPELAEGQETHRIWRDCDQKYRDSNPSIGDKEFHTNMVKTYQIRIDIIRSAIMYIHESHPLSPMSKDFVNRCESLTEGIEVDLDSPL